MTLYAGLRLWPGAEFWFNPEVDQGFGLSNTFGVAGYLSGEAYKVGQSDPYFLIQRTFLRQTIDLGGETEKLDPDLNQLGGTQTANRLVFTLGKFSVVDIFDTNKYAHDPRQDFFNWSIIDQGAFDYAANDWGYTYGGAAEWYQDWWTIRAGLFDLSTVPNGPNLALGFFHQRQWVAELEERHQLWDQPGKLKLLYWLTQGNLGTYGDAIALGQATGTTPSIAAVRRFRSKSGAGINLEQQLTAGLGFFARASLSQGNVEEDAFTDINQSLSAGFSLAGGRWGRPEDTVGLAGAVNRISHDGKLYLAAGGLGGIIGDGALPNAGPEQILEVYYSIPVFSFARLTADYQFVNNPAYNRDRGPVSVFGLRARAILSRFTAPQRWHEVITNKLGSAILVGVCVMVPARLRAADCQVSRIPPPAIHLRVDPPDDRIDTTKSLEQMRAAGKVRHAAPLVGAYLGVVQYGIKIDDTVRQTAARVFCVTPKYVTLKLALERIIYIPREFTSDPCLVALARDHETKHADTEAKALDTARPALETAVREAVRRVATVPGASRASALATLTAEIQSGVSHTLDEMARVRKQLDAEVDSPDEIGRLKTECGGQGARDLPASL